VRLLAALSAGFLGFALTGKLLGTPIRLERTRRRGPSRLERRQQWLLQSGARVSAQQFYAGSAMAGLLAFGLLAVLVDAWTVAIVPGVLCALLPQAYYGYLRRERLNEIIEAWPDGLRDLAAGVNAGQPLHQAILALARTGPAPLRRAFAGYGANARVSGTIPALEHIKSELADPTSDRVLEVLILAKERGARKLGQILDDLANATTADLRTNAEIETARLEPKLNTRITSALPWLVLILICLPSDSPHRLFYAGGGGVIVVLASAAFTIAGVLWVRVLARDPVEGRVFVSEEGGRG
jgi:tight adherence protein B